MPDRWGVCWRCEACVGLAIDDQLDRGSVGDRGHPAVRRRHHRSRGRPRLVGRKPGGQQVREVAERIEDQRSGLGAVVDAECFSREGQGDRRVLLLRGQLADSDRCRGRLRHARPVSLLRRAVVLVDRQADSEPGRDRQKRCHDVSGAREQPSAAAHRGRLVERRVMAQHRRLQRDDLWRGIDAEVVGQRGPKCPQRGERVALAVSGVLRAGEQRPPRFPVRGGVVPVARLERSWDRCARCDWASRFKSSAVSFRSARRRRSASAGAQSEVRGTARPATVPGPPLHAGLQCVGRRGRAPTVPRRRVGSGG